MTSLDPRSPYPAPVLLINADGAEEPAWLDGFSIEADQFTPITRPRATDELPLYAIHYTRMSFFAHIKRLAASWEEGES